MKSILETSSQQMQFSSPDDFSCLDFFLLPVTNRGSRKKDIWRRREVSEHQTLIYLLLSKEISIDDMILL
jgi:hypothetical protein